jgi:hypothetical protein
MFYYDVALKFEDRYKLGANNYRTNQPMKLVASDELDRRERGSQGKLILVSQLLSNNEKPGVAFMV